MKFAEALERYISGEGKGIIFRSPSERDVYYRIRPSSISFDRKDGILRYYNKSRNEYDSGIALGIKWLLSDKWDIDYDDGSVETKTENQIIEEKEVVDLSFLSPKFKIAE